MSHAQEAKQLCDEKTRPRKLVADLSLGGGGSREWRTRPLIVAALGLSIWLVGCGGASSSPNVVPTPPPPSPPPSVAYSIEANQAPVIPGMIDFAAYASVQSNPLLQGQTIYIAGANTGSEPLYIDTETGTGACSPTLDYTTLDSALTSTLLSNFILAPAKEGGTNDATPQCVFSQEQANASYLTYAQNTAYLPGEYIYQNGAYWQLQTGCGPTGYDDTCVTGTTAANFTGSGPVTDGTVQWVRIGANAPLQDGYCGSDYICGPAGSDCYSANGSQDIVITSATLGPCNLTQLYQSSPIPSELPIRNWFNQVIAGVINHYSGNSKVGYMRIGSPANGELSPDGLYTYILPNYGSSQDMARAQYLSWVNKFYAYVMSQNPTMMMEGDMHCVGIGGSFDCLLADQEAQLAYNYNYQLIATNGYRVADVLNLEGTGANPCPLPLVASSCNSGDWAYNFSRFSKNSAGQTMHHLLQTGAESTPMECPATIQPGSPGPLAQLPAGSIYCPGGFPGLLPFLVTLRTSGIGSPAQFVVVDYVELFVTGMCNGSAPTVGAADVLLALDPSYSTTTCAQPDYVPYGSAYNAAFQAYEGVSP